MRGLALALLLDALEHRQELLSRELRHRPLSDRRVQIRVNEPAVLLAGGGIEHRPHRAAFLSVLAGVDIIWIHSSATPAKNTVRASRAIFFSSRGSNPRASCWRASTRRSRASFKLTAG